MSRWPRRLAGWVLVLAFLPDSAPAQEPPGTYADAPFNQGTIFYNYYRAQGRRAARTRTVPRPSRRWAYRAAPAPPQARVMAPATARAPVQRYWAWTGRGWQLR